MLLCASEGVSRTAAGVQQYCTAVLLLGWQPLLRGGSALLRGGPAARQGAALERHVRRQALYRNNSGGRHERRGRPHRFPPLRMPHEVGPLSHAGPQIL